MRLTSSTIDALRRFLDGELDLPSFEAWLTEAVYDSDSRFIGEQQVLEGLRLLLIEYGENLRPLSDLYSEIESNLAACGDTASADSSNQLVPLPLAFVVQVQPIKMPDPV